MPFSFEAAFGSGYMVFKHRYGSILGAVVVFILVMIGASLVGMVLNRAFDLHPNPGEVTIPDALISIFFTNVFAVGIYLYAIQLHRGESPRMCTLFAGFGRYWPLVGVGALLWLIFGAIAFAVLIVAGLSGSFLMFSIGSGSGFGPGAALGVVIGVCVALSSSCDLGLSPSCAPILVSGSACRRVSPRHGE